MKGTVLRCLGELVREKFGDARWREVLAESNLPTDAFFSPLDDVADAVTFTVIGATCKVLNLSQAQAFEAFADHWMCVYGPKVYPRYYEGIHSAKQFMLNLDQLHSVVVRNMPRANPPRFEYSWTDDGKLRMKYKSERGLIDLMVWMTRAVGKYYKEDITVEKTATDELVVAFPPG